MIETPDASAAVINSDLQKIATWSSSWLVTFNPLKTESMIFSRKRDRPIHPPLLMNNVPIESVRSHKHIGLTFTDDAKWKDHISSILNKAWQRLGMLRSLKFMLSRSSLENMYLNFIRPLLEYGDVVWDNCTAELKNDIESVQNEAARIVSVATKLCNIHTLLADLRWDTLACRRRKHRLTLLYKMKHGLTPNYLTHMIPNQSQDRYPLRNAESIHLPLLKVKAQQYASSFLPATIRDWNSLSPETQQADTVHIFK